MRILMSHEGFTGGEYGAKTNLCEDDTFRVPISKKGMMKDPNPGYQTTMKGTQTVVGNNWEAILTFKVKKEPCSICCQFEVWKGGTLCQLEKDTMSVRLRNLNPKGIYQIKHSKTGAKIPDFTSFWGFNFPDFSPSCHPSFLQNGVEKNKNWLRSTIAVASFFWIHGIKPVAKYS